MSRGPLWDRMDAQPRIAASGLSRNDIPVSPGVYAWYRENDAVYVGSAKELRDRAWGRHMGEGVSMGTSAFRRNVAEHLGFGSSADIKKKRVRLVPDQLAQTRSWILRCSLSWIECRSAAEAIDLEIAIKNEWLPPLTKR